MAKRAILAKSVHDRAADEHMDISEFLGRLLCWLGLHDYRMVDATFGFGAGGSVERDECRRCGDVRTRRM